MTTISFYYLPVYHYSMRIVNPSRFSYCHHMHFANTTERIVKFVNIMILVNLV